MTGRCHAVFGGAPATHRLDATWLLWAAIIAVLLFLV